MIPVGSAEVDTVSAELNPPKAVQVTVTLPLPEGGSVTDPGLTAKVKLETETVTIAVRVTPPPLAVMVSG